MKKFVYYLLPVLLLCCAIAYTCSKHGEFRNTNETDDIDDDTEYTSPRFLGKYLYLTENGVLHTRKTCVGVKYGKDEDGHEVYGMQFIDTAEYVENGNVVYCTRCFNDNLYEKVHAISMRNRYGDADTISIEY